MQKLYMILTIILLLALPGVALEKVRTGPYNIEFNVLNTTGYDIYSDKPDEGETYSGYTYQHYWIHGTDTKNCSVIHIDITRYDEIIKPDTDALTSEFLHSYVEDEFSGDNIVVVDRNIDGYYGVIAINQSNYYYGTSHFMDKYTIVDVRISDWCWDSVREILNTLHIKEVGSN